ncbi:MAG: M48 family metalloprotease, partial [Phormidesmis sp.]
EMGHLQHRDPLRALGRSLVFVTLSSLLGMGQSTSALPGMVNLAELSYSRQQETAADDYAQALIVAHYGHGSHSLDFFERNLGLDLGAFNRVAEWQQTHPMSGDRIRRLQSKFEQKGWPQTGATTPLPDFIGCENFQPCGK